MYGGAEEREAVLESLQLPEAAQTDRLESSVFEGGRKTHR